MVSHANREMILRSLKKGADIKVIVGAGKHVLTTGVKFKDGLDQMAVMIKSVDGIDDVIYYNYHILSCDAIDVANNLLK